MFGQSFICVTEDDPAPDPPGKHSYSTDLQLLNTYSPVVFNVKSWILLEDNDVVDLDSPFYTSFTEDDALEAVATLNRAYNQFNIFFKYNGISAIADSEVALTINPCDDPDDPCNYELCNPDDYPNYTPYWLVDNILKDTSTYNDPNSINIYVMKETVCYGGVRWESRFIGIGTGGFNGPSLVHEIGHAFNLYHTHSGYSGNNCEQVTRDQDDLDDPNDPDDTFFNAIGAGDRVVDTNAIPNMSINQGINTYDDDDCVYTGMGSDCKGTPYTLTNLDIVNTMSYTFDCISNYISPGEAVRMREFIATSTMLIPATTTIETLFDPYEGDYYLAGPVLPTDRPLFQPGFDYEFVECYGPFPQPAPYGIAYATGHPVLIVDKFDTNYNSIVHPNHTAIKIVQLYDRGSIPPQKCYNNFNRASKGGKVTKFLDGMLNTNILETPKDSLQINNPVLIDNLETGLYKIEKDFEDGSKTQVIIQKNND